MDTTTNNSYRTNSDLTIVGALALISLAALVLGLRGKKKNKSGVELKVRKGEPVLVEQTAPVK